MNYIPDLIFFSKGFTHSHKQYMPYNKYGPKHTRLESRINDKDSTVVAGIFSPFATSHICHWHKKNAAPHIAVPLQTFALYQPVPQIFVYWTPPLETFKSPLGLPEHPIINYQQLIIITLCFRHRKLCFMKHPHIESTTKYQINISTIYTRVRNNSTGMDIFLKILLRINPFSSSRKNDTYGRMAHTGIPTDSKS